MWKEGGRGRGSGWGGGKHFSCRSRCKKTTRPSLHPAALHCPFPVYHFPIRVYLGTRFQKLPGVLSTHPDTGVALKSADDALLSNLLCNPAEFVNVVAFEGLADMETKFIVDINPSAASQTHCGDDPFSVKVVSQKIIWLQPPARLSVHCRHCSSFSPCQSISFRGRRE